MYCMAPVGKLPDKAPLPAMTVNLPPNARQAQRMQVCSSCIALVAGKASLFGMKYSLENSPGRAKVFILGLESIRSAVGYVPHGTGREAAQQGATSFNDREPATQRHAGAAHAGSYIMFL